MFENPGDCARRKYPWGTTPACALGCALLALLAAVYVGFFWKTAQCKQASRQTAMEYVTPVTLPTAPEQPSRETEPATPPTESTVPETTAETQPPRFPSVDFAALAEKNEDVVAFKDLNPQAPTHLLIIPKKHISRLAEAQDGDAELLGKVLLAARDLAKKYDIKDFRLVTNNGKGAGQSVQN